MDIAMSTEDWLKKNTYHHSAFWDIMAMVREKEKQGLKISLCIPTLNEEKTIGKEIVLTFFSQVAKYGNADNGIKLIIAEGQRWVDACQAGSHIVEVPSNPIHMPFINIAAHNPVRVSLEHPCQAPATAAKIQYVPVISDRFWRCLR